ncbi:unnamed protein product [Durusdinium trenchii]|uniref:RING-type domain-containing protein n=1 Tax=Durusdinium trenchii TaxID=1381693 RepID=A0ABP0SBB4_9DINO
MEGKSGKARVFDEMDSQLKALAQENDFMGPLKDEASEVGLRRGLREGDSKKGLPRRGQSKGYPGDVTIQRQSQLAPSMPQGALKKHLEGLAQSLERMQWTEQLQQLQSLTKLSSKKAAVDGNTPFCATETGSEATRLWRPERVPQKLLAVLQEPIDDARVALELQMQLQSSGDGQCVGLGSQDRVNASENLTSQLTDDLSASDEAIALILSLDEPDPAFDEPRNYRAEARSRAEVRRQRQEDIEDLRLRTAEQTSSGESDDEFYQRLWGLPPDTEDLPRLKDPAHTTLGTIILGVARRRRSTLNRRMRESPGLRTLRSASLPRPAPPTAPPARRRPRPHLSRPPAPEPEAPQVSDGATALISFSPQQGETSTEVQCTICCEDFVEGERLRLLPCLHRYHVQCIDRWLSHSQTCPVCKHSVSS